MNSTGLYLMKSGIALAIFLFVYILLLRNKTNFKSNRWFLLAALLISQVLPLIDFSFLNISSSVFNSTDFQVQLAPLVVGIKQTNAFNTLNIFALVYSLGIIIFLIHFIYKNLQILKIYRNSSPLYISNYKVYIHNFNNSPFSFLGGIFIHKDYLSHHSLEQILEHEQAHAEQGHSYDVLLLELICAIQWFNPVVWISKKAIREVHEYLADQAVMNKGKNIAQYQHTLVDQVCGIDSLAIANHLNKSLIKKRISMMTKMKTNPKTGLGLWAILPISLALGFVFACSEQVNESKQNEIEEVAVTTKAQVKTSEEIEEFYYQVEKMPKFTKEDDGTGLDFRQYIAKNLKYPDVAAKSETQAKIFIHFILTKEGKISEAKIIETRVDGKVVSERSEGIIALEEEALRVVNQSPTWEVIGEDKGKKVSVAFTFPIVFVLS